MNKVKLAFSAVSLFLTGPWGWAIVGTIAGLSILVAILTKIQSPLEKYKNKLREANESLSELNKEQEEFNKVQKEYVKALKSGNKAEAARIANQNISMQNIHWQVMREKDHQKALKKSTELIEAKTKALKNLEEETIKSKRGTEIDVETQKLVESGEKLEEQLTTLRKQDPDQYFSDFGKSKEEALDEFTGVRIKETQEGLNWLRGSISEYVEAHKDEEDILEKLDLSYGKYIRKLSLFSHSLIDVNQEIKQFLEALFFQNEELKATETYMKELASKGIPNLVDSSKAVTTWFNKIKSENKDLRDYLKRNPFTESFLGKTFEEDPEKALQSVAKVQELLKKTSGTWISEAKDALNLTEEQMKKMGDAEFLNLVASYRLNALSGAFGFDEGKRVRQIQEEGREFEKFIKDALSEESELKKEINSIEEDYAKKRREEIKSKEYSIELDQREIDLKNVTYEKAKKSLEQTREENKLALEGLDKTGEEKEVLDLEKERKKALKDIQNQVGGVLEVSGELALTEDSINKLYDERIARLRIEQENNRKRLIAEKRTEEIAKEISLLELNDPQNKEKINQLQKEQVNITLAMLRSLNKSKMEDKDRLDINKEITDDLIKQIELQEEYLRLTDPVYDAMQRIKEEQQSFNEMLSDVIYTGYSSMTSGLTDFLQEMTGGFQKAQQEVVNLEGELTTLYREKDELAEQEFLTEEDAERFRELNQEIEDTKNKIDDLEDPLKNAGDAFKDFAKSVIDEIRNIINQWIAMQIVTGLFKAAQTLFGGKNTEESFIFDENSNLGLGNQLEEFYLTGRGSGGILPKIQSMRAYGSGGVTGNPAMAILGDNSSHKELVIPSENIKNDSVHGYTRNKDESTVNIINVVTESDLANALARPMPGKVVINHVYREQRNKV
jgi:DNA repair exonuclease SbcCD ATPase subunit